MNSLTYGASADDWAAARALGAIEDVLPVVSNPSAKPTPTTKVKAPCKTPSMYDAQRRFHGLTGWTERRSTDGDIAKWSKEPDHGICIQTRLNRAIDIDVTDEALAKEIECVCLDSLGCKPPRRGRSNSSKSLLAIKLPGDYRKRTIKTAHGVIEFLADGEQFVACGTHPTGVRYEWDDGRSMPSFIPTIEPERFEALWASLHRQFNIEEGSNAPTVARQFAQGDLSESDAVLAAIEAPAPKPLGLSDGQIAETLALLPEDLSYDHWLTIGAGVHHETSGKGFDLFLRWSQTSPKHHEKHANPDQDARDKWESFKRSTGNVATMASVRKILAAHLTVQSIAQYIEQHGKDGPALAPQVIARLVHASLSASDEDSILKLVKGACGASLAALRKDLTRARAAASDTGEGQPPPTHHGYAIAYLDHLEKKCGGSEIIGVEGVLYVLGNDCVYRPKTIDEAASEVARLFDGRDKCERRTDYRAIAQHAYSLCERPDFFAGAPVGLACVNGFYRIIGDGSIVHETLGAGHRQRYVHQVAPTAGPMPLFTAFIVDAFRSESSGESQEQVNRLQEIAGAVALGLMAPFQKVVKFYGPGRSGKGTATKIIEATVPAEGKVSVSPHRWDSEYYLASLAGKLLNSVGELSDTLPIPHAEFKTVTGGDLLMGRHPTGRPFPFRNAAAHVFSSNHFISTKDHSSAFYARWLFVGFLNSRLDQNKSIETDLADRIIANELPAILAWALDGAARLVKRKHFAPTAVHDRLMASWQRRTDSLMEFLHDEDLCKLDDLFFEPIKRTTVFESYVSWCLTSGRKPMSKHRFNEEIESPGVQRLGVRVRRTAAEREVVDGVQLRGHMGDFSSQ